MIDHDDADLLSFIPFIGLPADVVNTAAYAAEGNTEEVVWSLVGAIPFLGDGATIIRKTLKRVDCNSFVPGTEVLMADGTSKPIEDVRVGDEVLATDPETGESVAKPVVALIVGEGEKNLTQVTVESGGKTGNDAGVVITTDGHPFWVPELNKWINAGDLRPGMWLRTSTGVHTQVKAIKKQTALQRVHNLTIADIHTYHVLAGTIPVLVHNSGPCPHVDMTGVPKDAQPYVENVIRQMDTDGTRPPLVKQGKSKLGQGIYGGEGLPDAPPRYWVETDIFPTMAGQKRPDGRLVFGARGEIYYSRHYSDFIMLRGPGCGC